MEPEWWACSGSPHRPTPSKEKKIKKGTEGGEEEIARIGTSVIYSLPPCFHITWFLPHPTTTINRPSIISTLTGDIQFPVRRFIYFEHVKRGHQVPPVGLDWNGALLQLPHANEGRDNYFVKKKIEIRRRQSLEEDFRSATHTHTRTHAGGKMIRDGAGMAEPPTGPCTHHPPKEGSIKREEDERERGKKSEKKSQTKGALRGFGCVRSLECVRHLLGRWAD